MGRNFATLLIIFLIFIEIIILGIGGLLIYLNIAPVFVLLCLIWHIFFDKFGIIKMYRPNILKENHKKITNNYLKTFEKIKSEKDFKKKLFELRIE